jgi:hypothetical protein
MHLQPDRAAYRPFRGRKTNGFSGISSLARREPVNPTHTTSDVRLRGSCDVLRFGRLEWRSWRPDHDHRSVDQRWRAHGRAHFVGLSGIGQPGGHPRSGRRARSKRVRLSGFLQRASRAIADFAKRHTGLPWRQYVQPHLRKSQRPERQLEYRGLLRGRGEQRNPRACNCPIAGNRAVRIPPVAP